MLYTISKLSLILAVASAVKGASMLEYWEGVQCEGTHIDSWTIWEYPNGYTDGYCSYIPEKDEFQSFIFKSTNGEKLQLFYHPTCGKGSESQIFEAGPGCVSLLPGKSIAGSLKILGSDADVEALSVNGTVNFA